MIPLGTHFPSPARWRTATRTASAHRNIINPQVWCSISTGHTTRISAQFTPAETGTAVEFRDELGKEFAKNAACSAAGWGVGKALGANGKKAGCFWNECKAWRQARRAAK